MRVVEVLAFGSLAVAAHLGAWAWQTGAGPGMPPAGDEGEAKVTLSAASGDIGALVREWTTPPEVTTSGRMAPAAPQPDAALQDVAMPGARTKDTPPVRFKAPSARPAQPLSGDTMPDADTKSVEPLVSHAPTASVRPKTRPERNEIEPQRPAPAQPEAKAPAKQPAQKATSAQTSSGSNAGSGTGTAKADTAPAVSQAQRQSLMAQWGGAIRHGIERRKRYPRGTSASGTAQLRITISRQGRLIGVSVTRSSGNPSLDRAAVEAVRRTRYPSAPRGLSQPSYAFNLPIAFQRR